MLKSIFEFFRQNPFYRNLFWIVLVVYGFLGLMEARMPKTVKPEAAAMKAYQRAEKQFENKIREAGDQAKYFEKNPELAGRFQVLGSVFVLLLALGCLADFLLVLKPGLRNSVTGPEHSGSAFRWNFWLLLKFVLLFLAAALLMNLIPFILRIFFPRASGNFLILLDTLLLEFCSLFIILYLIRSEKGSWALAGFYLPKRKVLPELTAGVFGYLAVLPVFTMVLIAVVGLAQMFHYEPPAHPLMDIFLEEEGSSFMIGFSLFLACVAAPFFEEVFFRGFCYPIIREKYGRGVAMTVTASLFAFIHESTFAFWPIFVLGLALGYLYEKRRNLLAPWVLHMMHNSLFIGYFFMMKSMVMPEAG